MAHHTIFQHLSQVLLGILIHAILSTALQVGIIIIPFRDFPRYRKLRHRVCSSHVAELGFEPGRFDYSLCFFVVLFR